VPGVEQANAAGNYCHEHEDVGKLLGAQLFKKERVAYRPKNDEGGGHQESGA
jgi:hypothetical protein